MACGPFQVPDQRFESFLNHYSGRQADVLGILRVSGRGQEDIFMIASLMDKFMDTKFLENKLLDHSTHRP